MEILFSCQEKSLGIFSPNCWDQKLLRDTYRRRPYEGWVFWSILGVVFSPTPPPPPPPQYIKPRNIDFTSEKDVENSPIRPIEPEMTLRDLQISPLSRVSLSIHLGVVFSPSSSWTSEISISHLKKLLRLSLWNHSNLKLLWQIRKIHP